MPVLHPSPLPTSFVGRIPPPSSAKLLGITTTTTTATSSPSASSTSSRKSPSITSIPIPRMPASRERRAPHHASVTKRKRLASSASSSALSFAVGSPKEKRRSIFPTPPLDDNSGYLNLLDEDHKNDDESLPFPMDTPLTPPYPMRREVIALATKRSDANTKVTSDLLKGLGIRVVREGSQISVKHVSGAAISYEEDDLDRTFWFDEEVGVGEAKFQSFLTTETDEDEDEDEDEESELESDLDDAFN